MNYSEINILLFDSLLDNNLNELKKKKEKEKEVNININIILQRNFKVLSSSIKISNRLF